VYGEGELLHACSGRARLRRLGLRRIGCRRQSL